MTTDTYDANGNTTSSAGISNTYDFENRMTAHGSLLLVYDGDGNRVSETVGSTTTKYLVDTQNPTGYWQVMNELVSGSVTRAYAYGLQRIGENQLSAAGGRRASTGTTGTETCDSWRTLQALSRIRMTSMASEWQSEPAAQLRIHACTAANGSPAA